MASEWFYTSDDKNKSGPVSSAQLQALAKSGQIKPTDLVWKEGMAQWHPASKIKGLFPSASGIAPEIAAGQISSSQTCTLGAVQKLAVLTLRPLAGFACTALGIPGKEIVVKGVGQVVDFLADKFKDDSQRLSVALNNANEKAWKTLEIALAGESFWNRLMVKGEDSSFARQIRAFLDSVAHSPDFQGNPDFRQCCIDEIRAARRKGILFGANYDSNELAKHTGAFARYSDPVGLLNAEWQFISQLADALEKDKYKNLATLLRV